MKNALLAFALFAFAGTAVAHDGPPAKGKNAKSAKKETCPMSMASGSCCMKGGAKATATAATKAPAAAATKSL